MNKVYQTWKNTGTWIAAHPLATLAISLTAIIVLLWIGLRY